MATCMRKSCSFQFTVRIFREQLSTCRCPPFAFGFEAGMWDSIILIPGHCVSLNLTETCRRVISMQYVRDVF